MLMYYVLHSTNFKPYLCYVIKSKTIKINKMKTINSNNSVATIEIAKRVMFLIQVLIVGLFIPFSFIFGISYKNHTTVAEKSINIKKANPVNYEEVTIDFGKVLTNKNS